MLHVQELFHSPEWFPLTIDIKQRIIIFTHLKPGRYDDYMFLSLQAAQRRGADIREVRLDDVIFAAASTRSNKGPVHYILHTAYCCSTLLARYFDLMPHCIVLKEPELLAQIAFAQNNSRQWKDAFNVSVKLLCRTYAQDQRVVIKAHVPCNTLGRLLLEENENATIIYLIPRLRSFLLAVLKSMDRCNRVRSWNRHLARLGIAPPQLDHVDPDALTSGQSAAYWWLTNRFLSAQLCEGPYAARVRVIDADVVPDSPRETLHTVTHVCETHFDEQHLISLANHPSIQQYSKDLSRPYDAEVRQREFNELEKCWGSEANRVIEWLASQNLPQYA
jgi:hypothetical protein